MAQDTTITISEVVVTDRTTPLRINVTETLFDSITKSSYLNKSIAELIRDNSAVFIKSYGNGALNSISFRGTSSVHSSVIWNGMPVNLSSTGDIDLSNNSIVAFDKVSLVHGGSGSLFGTGSIGGNVLLSNIPEFNKGFLSNASYTYGSFEKHAYSASSSISNESTSFKLNLFGMKNENHFFYADFNENSASAKKRMEFSKQQSFGYSASLSKKFQKSILSLYSWLEDHKRDIPAALTSFNPYAAQQSDQNFRNMVEFKRYGSNGHLTAKTGVSLDKLGYHDTIIRLVSEGQQFTLFPEISYTRTVFTNATLIAGSNAAFITAKNNNYSNTVTRQQAAFFAGIVKNISGYNLSLNLREDLISSIGNAFTFNATASKLIGSSFRVKAAAGKNFRAPSLNDLYWVPGGNPDLKSEQGWSQEAGLEYFINKAEKRISISSTLFSNLTDNWIIWLPQTATVWTPRNIRKVWSRGIEVTAKTQFTIGKVNVRMHAAYSYTEATNETKDLAEELIHEQIIYVPYYNASGTTHLLYQKFRFTYNQVFTGGRYTSTDHTSALPWFTIGNTRLSYSIESKKLKAELFIALNNVWDVSYQVIDFRPMPGREIETGINFQIR